MEVVLVLVGSVLGLLGSVTGSLLVSRHEVKRSQRLELYEAAVPNLRSAAIAVIRAVEDNPNPPAPSLQAVFDASYRLSHTAMIIGRTERTLAQSVASRVKELARLRDQLGSNRTWDPGRFTDGVSQVVDALQLLENHLRVRLA